MTIIRLENNYKIRMLGYDSQGTECLEYEQENPEKAKFCIECGAKLE